MMFLLSKTFLIPTESKYSYHQKSSSCSTVLQHFCWRLESAASCNAAPCCISKQIWDCGLQRWNAALKLMLVGAAARLGSVGSDLHVPCGFRQDETSRSDDLLLLRQEEDYYY